MSECRWTYYDPAQGNHTLGLYHGPESGHVMIYHNNTVVIIDFQVHTSKSYSFVYNKNLLRLHIVKGEDGFKYNFERSRIQETKPALSTLDWFKSLVRNPLLAFS